MSIEITYFFECPLFVCLVCLYSLDINRSNSYRYLLLTMPTPFFLLFFFSLFNLIYGMPRGQGVCVFQWVARGERAVITNGLDGKPSIIPVALLIWANSEQLYFCCYR